MSRNLSNNVIIFIRMSESNVIFSLNYGEELFKAGSATYKISANPDVVVSFEKIDDPTQTLVPVLFANSSTVCIVC